MKLNNRVVVSVAVAAVLSACSAAPPRNESLETARTMVPEVEKSPRAGVAAMDIANARKSLDAANRLAASKGKRSDIEYEAKNAVTQRADRQREDPDCASERGSRQRYGPASSRSAAGART